jgi:alkaline phosphatase
MKPFRKSIGLITLVLTMLALATMANAGNLSQLKYVFFFLGDGMASSQIQATEAYLTTKNGGNAMVAEDLLQGKNRLNMSKMQVAGMQTTYDARALMTDSASSATAFASGLKTLSGVIGMDETKTTSYKSIAQLAHEAGKKVGILSSVSLDHATPAAYYASVASRGYANNIATQMANTGYEFFGGGGLVKPTCASSASSSGGSSSNPSSETCNNIWDLLATRGYRVLNTRASILALKNTPRDKVVCINPVLPTSSAMPYAIDKPTENLSLAEMTEVAIENLYKEGRKRNGKGFFIMVEGGKIDWACHANDAMATIGDMLDFDDAIGVALDFYNKHPHETLIVVTGDHETGGMSVGHATTGYSAYYDKLLGQKQSFEDFQLNEFAAYKQTHGCASTVPIDMINLMQTQFGLKWAELNTIQQNKLNKAYQQSLCTNSSDRPYNPTEQGLLYAFYEPLTVTITQILNEKASIGWTSYSHTGVPVPIFAQGRQAYRFAGFYDNTDIAKKLAQAMGLADLPAVK